MKINAILCTLLMSLPLAFAADSAEENNVNQKTAEQEQIQSPVDPTLAKSGFRKFMDGETGSTVNWRLYFSLNDMDPNVVSALERLYDVLYRSDEESERLCLSLKTQLDGLPDNEENKIERKQLDDQIRDLLWKKDAIGHSLFTAVCEQNLHNFNFPDAFLDMFRAGGDQKEVCELFRNLLKNVPHGVATNDKWFKVVLNLLTNLPDNERNYETLSWFVTTYVDEIKANPNISAKTRLRVFRDAERAQQKSDPNYRLTKSDIERLFREAPSKKNMAKTKAEFLSKKIEEKGKDAGEVVLMVIKDPLGLPAGLAIASMVRKG